VQEAPQAQARVGASAGAVREALVRSLGCGGSAGAGASGSAWRHRRERLCGRRCERSLEAGRERPLRAAGAELCLRMRERLSVAGAGGSAGAGASCSAGACAVAPRAQRSGSAKAGAGGSAGAGASCSAKPGAGGSAAGAGRRGCRPSRSGGSLRVGRREWLGRAGGPLRRSWRSVSAGAGASALRKAGAGGLCGGAGASGLGGSWRRWFRRAQGAKSALCRAQARVVPLIAGAGGFPRAAGAVAQHAPVQVASAGAGSLALWPSRLRCSADRRGLLLGAGASGTMLVQRRRPPSAGWLSAASEWMPPLRARAAR